MADAILSQLGNRLDLFMVEGTDFDFTVDFADPIADWSDFAANAQDRTTGELVEIAIDTAGQASDELVLLLEGVSLASGSRWEFTGTDADGHPRQVAAGYCYVRSKVESA